MKTEKEIEELQPPRLEEFETDEGIDFIAFYDALEDYELEKAGIR